MSDPPDLDAIKAGAAALGGEAACRDCRWLSEANRAMPRAHPVWPCSLHDPHRLAAAVPALVAEVERLRALLSEIRPRLHPQDGAVWYIDEALGAHAYQTPPA